MIFTMRKKKPPGKRTFASLPLNNATNPLATQPPCLPNGPPTPIFSHPLLVLTSFCLISNGTHSATTLLYSPDLNTLANIIGTAVPPSSKSGNHTSNESGCNKCSRASFASSLMGIEYSGLRPHNEGSTMSAIEIVMERKARVKAVRREGGVVGVKLLMEKRNARGAFRRRRVMKEDGLA
jgi:hypothetical protein